MCFWKLSSLLTVLLVASCTKSTTPTAHKDQLRFPLFAEPSSWDSTLVQDTASQEILLALMDGLTKRERYGKTLPAIAERWEISKDGKQIHFFLRVAKWSDGRDVRAEDFLFAWQRLLDPKNTNPFATKLFAIDHAEDFHTGKVTNFAEVGIKSPEPTRIDLTLAHTDTSLLESLSMPPCGPQRSELVTNVADAFANPEKMRTTGPYLVKKWEKGFQLQLVANPEYYGRHPQISNVVFYFFRDLGAAMPRYEKGELDVLMPVPTGENDKWKQSPDFATVVVLKLQTGLVAQPQYEKIGVLAKSYVDNFPVDVYGQPLFASARFRQENVSEQ